ncbi:hypothetical protein RK21_00864 [Pseudomonas plecoglossicida]|nr:hypothetical protein RK21_00864 [Pseudomonas plecoglossicida]
MAPAAPVFAGMPAPTGAAPNLENNAVSVGAALCRERAA